MDKALDNWEHYIHARDAGGHLDFVRKANKCLRTFFGDHWDELHRHILERQNKPVLTINKMFATLSTVMGMQVQGQASVSFQPSAGGTQETANALNKLWLHVLNDQDLRFKEASLFDIGIITSRAFFDCRIGFDDNLHGEVRITLKNSKNIIIDPDADQYDPDTWGQVIETAWMHPDHIEQLYGKKHADELRRRGPSGSSYGQDSMDFMPGTFAGTRSVNSTYGSTDATENLRRWVRVIDRQYRVLQRLPHFVDLVTGDLRLIPPSWDHNRIAHVKAKYGLGVIERMVSRIHWTVSADDLVLFDAESPYKHFTIIPYFPYFIEGQTIGLAENMLSPGEMLNKSLSQELHVINTTANSGWQMEEDQLVNMDPEELEQRGAETGLVIVRKAGTPALEKIQPNQIPTGLDRLSYKADEYLKEVSNVSDSVKGFDRADVAGKAIKAKQQASTANLAKPLFNLAYTRRILAGHVLDLWQEYYTEERAYTITGDGLAKEPESLVINQPQEDGSVMNDLTVGEYKVVIIDAPLRETFEETQFEEAVQLRELGIPIPDHHLIQASHLAAKHEIVEELKRPPTEEEIRAKNAELETLEAAAMERKANAALKLAQAKAKLGDGTEMEKLRAEIELEREKAQLKMQIEREKHKHEMRMKYEEHQLEMQLKREMAEAEAALKRAQARQMMQQQAAKAKESQEAVH